MRILRSYWMVVLLAVAGTVDADDFVEVYSATNLAGFAVSAECNPGGGVTGVVFECSTVDVDVVHFDEYSVVKSNVRKTNIWVNAIAGTPFVETLPGGQRILPGVYRYSGQFRIPQLPAADLGQVTNGQSSIAVMFFWDGRDAVLDSAGKSIEAGLLWTVNAWDTNNAGRIHVYTLPVAPVDSGMQIAVDTNWHAFSIEADYRSKRFGVVSVDGQSVNLSHIPLAEVDRPGWGPEVALLVTQESLSTWPGHFCEYAFTWDTHYRNIALAHRPFREPAWWWERRVLDVPVMHNDHAAVNAGQLKWLARQAYTAMTNAYGVLGDLPSTGSPSASNLVHGFMVSTNHVVVTGGQLKYVAEPFWRWLIDRGSATNYPWSITTVDDEDYAPVNIGQVKRAFGFHLP